MGKNWKREIPKPILSDGIWFVHICQQSGPISGFERALVSSCWCCGVLPWVTLIKALLVDLNKMTTIVMLPAVARSPTYHSPQPFPKAEAGTIYALLSPPTSPLQSAANMVAHIVVQPQIGEPLEALCLEVSEISAMPCNDASPHQPTQEHG